MSGLNITMDNKIFFSIICPTFNSEKFIEKNIRSILNQTYQDYEIIYSDDGSSDQTLTILKKYKNFFLEKNINIQILKNSHYGPGAARNKGIKSSNYEWISFIDSDDEWEKHKLERVASIIKNNSNYNCVVHNEFLKKIDENILKLDYKKNFNPNKSIYKQLFLRNLLSTSSVSLKKKLIEDANYFDESLANAQDYDLWLKIGDNFNLCFLSDYLGTYNERSANITATPYKYKIKNLMKILKKNKRYISKVFYYYRFMRLIFNKEWFK
jgi:teichuronic acid biosynthesis glycosyltransferase TuaG